MFSLERRRERYTIIYVWKILEELVPCCTFNPITTYWSDRQGRKCRVPMPKGQGKIKTLREQTLAIRGPNIFNSLPPYIRNLSGVSLDRFKKKLDESILRIPDFPILPGYRDPFGGSSNSIKERVCQIDIYANEKNNGKFFNEGATLSRTLA